MVPSRPGCSACDTSLRPYSSRRQLFQDPDYILFLWRMFCETELVVTHFVIVARYGIRLSNVPGGRLLKGR